MLNFISIEPWQAHHLMLFSVGGVRFDLHFVIWMVFLGWFFLWCKSVKERLVAIVLAGGQLLVLAFAFGLDYLDFVNWGLGNYGGFVLNITAEQERSLGVRPDALAFAFIDYLTIIVLTKLVVRPRRMIDPILSILLCLILLHLVVATFNFSSSGALMAYDLLWIVFYYGVFATLLITSGRMESYIGHLSVFDYSHILFGSYRSKKISKKC